MSGDSLLSVVVPLFNERENVEPLVVAVGRALESFPSWELVLVDDGSTDGTADVAAAFAAADDRVRLVRLARNYGQTPAMQAGFDFARGEVVVSMDGDLQNDPEDIPPLVAMLRQGYDLVTGYRVRRQDRLLTRKVPSWVGNRLIQRITGVAIRDNGCSLKAYTRELLDRLHLYSDMHRFIPALAASTAGARIAEIPVRHHPRRKGASKYGLSKIPTVLADLLTIKMIRTFRERPLAMFGTAAVAAALIGFVFAAAAVVSLVAFQTSKAEAFIFPGAALLWVGLACYLLMLGLVAEAALRIERYRGPSALQLVREERYERKG